MTQRSLPNHWYLVPLSSISRIQGGFAFKSKEYQNQGIPIVRIGNVKVYGLDWSNTVYWTEELPEYLKRYLLKPQDILISMTGEVGVTTQVQNSDTPSLLNQRVGRFVIKDNSLIDPDFLFYITQSLDFTNDVRAAAFGAIQLNISAERIEKINIPLPPFDEQMSITRILKASQAAIQKRRDELKLEHERKNALMEYLFTYGTHCETTKQTEIGQIPRHWDLKKCAEICQTISVGIVVRPASYYVSSGVPAFRSLNIREDHLSTNDLVFVSKEDNESVLAKSKLRTGDVLIVRTGEPGISCVVPPEYDGSNCIDIIFARPKATLMTSEFLSRFMNTSNAKRQAFKARTGIAQQHLNVGAVQRIEVPLPPLNEQQEIVHILKSCDEKVDELEQEMMLLEELFHTLLEEFITGQLSALPFIKEGETRE